MSSGSRQTDLSGHLIVGPGGGSDALETDVGGQEIFGGEEQVTQEDLGIVLVIAVAVAVHERFQLGDGLR